MALTRTGPYVEELQDAFLSPLEQTFVRRSTPAWERRYAWSLRLLDALGAAGAHLAAAHLVGRDDGGAVSASLVTVALLVAAVTGGAYEGRHLGAGSEEFRRVADAALRSFAVVAVVLFALGETSLGATVVAGAPLVLAQVLIGRTAARLVLNTARRRGLCRHRTIVVGRERSVAEFQRQVARDAHSPLMLVGACLDRPARGVVSVDGLPVLGTSADITMALLTRSADTVVITSWSELSEADLRRLCWRLEGSGVDVVVAPRISDVAGPRLTIRPVAGMPLLHVEEPAFHGWRRVVKGLTDRAVAGLALLLLAPLFAVISVLIRRTSEGPAFFRQERVGRDGRTFQMVKFRSMRQTAEEELRELLHANEAADGVLFKMRQDPRITPIGGWLRRYSIDELPQLINVVRGEMSLVGPRPPLPREVAQYERHVHRRLLVKPGLTGLWQVSGRSDLTWEESVRLDLDYVENWTPGLDLRIVLKTISAVAAGRGAY